tara:strand:- start:251 stop:502 length:252 start_codon:yes stop_codon:yes gene_type:complete
MMDEFEKLKKEDGQWKMIIIDEEGDDINLSFNYDNCVNVDTEKYSYLTLSIENLYMMIQAIEDSEEEYFKDFNKIKKEGGEIL